MSSNWFAVTVDCTDAPRVAEFWSEVLGWQTAHVESSGRHVVLVPDGAPDGGPRLVFNVVPEPKTVKDRLHLDVISEAYDTEIDRLLALGACMLVEHRGDTSRWTTFTDVEGNEFDLIDGRA